MSQLVLCNDCKWNTDGSSFCFEDRCPCRDDNDCSTLETCDYAVTLKLLGIETDVNTCTPFYATTLGLVLIIGIPVFLLIVMCCCCRRSMSTYSSVLPIKN